jgi:hypothetical protein
MFSGNNFTFQDKIAISTMCAFILVIAVLRYTGIPDQYAVLFWLFQNIDNYTNNIFLSDLFFFKSSYFFGLNTFFGLNSNENVTFAWYLGSTVAALYLTYKIVNRHFGLMKPLEVFVVLIFISIVDRNFPLGGWGGVLPTTPGIPAMYTRVLALLAIYYMLENRIWLSSIIITIVIALHIPGDFILFPILFFFVVFNKEIANRNLVALVLPIAFLLYRWLTNDFVIPSGSGPEIADTYERVMYLAETDGDFLKHSILVLVLFGASFFVCIAFWQRFRNTDPSFPNMLPLLKAIYVATLLVVIFATIYTTVGYKLYFYPPLIMLNPVRAMNFYSLFFLLSAFVFTLQTAKLTSIEKVSIMLALVMLHGHSLNGILYPAVIITGALVVSRFSGDLLSWLKGGKALIPLSLALLIALTGARTATGTFYYTSIDMLNWQHMKRWRSSLTDTDESVWDAYQKIRDMKPDFSMLPFYRTTDGKLKRSPFLNIFAEKPLFQGDAHHFYFNGKLNKEHKLRTKATNEIFSSIENNRPLSEWTRNLLQSRGVTIVVPNTDSAILTGWVERTEIGSFHMLRYSAIP